MTIIVGGPYAASLSTAAQGRGLEAARAGLGADVYVVGREGELANTVDNLVFRQGTRLISTDHRPESHPPAEDMVDYSLFPARDRNEFVTTRTGTYTYLDLADIERELDSIAALPGVSTVTFIDDAFNVPGKGSVKSSS